MEIDSAYKLKHFTSKNSNRIRNHFLYGQVYDRYSAVFFGKKRYLKRVEDKEKRYQIKDKSALVLHQSAAFSMCIETLRYIL